jgi:prepilin-type N-terminal cleavage/methylation domain-containing protein
MNRRGLTLLELLVVLAILISLATIVVPVISMFGGKSQEVATRENLLRLQDLLVNRYIPDLGGGTYVSVGSGVNPYKGTRIGNMVANLPAPGAVGYAERATYHPQLRYLFVNPDDSVYPETMNWVPNLTALATRRWQGPYIRHTGGAYKIHVDGVIDGIDPSFTTVYGEDGDPTVFDAWGRPIVIQVPTGTDSGAESITNEPGVNFARLVSAGPDGVIDTSESVFMPTATERDDDIIIFLFHHDKYGDGYLKLE